jgi:hypothetical protein
MAGRHALPCLQRRLGQIAGRGTSRTGDDDRRRMIALVVDSTPYFQRRGAFRTPVDRF